MLLVDTSVAVKWVIPEDGRRLEAGTAEALDLLPHALTAPDCMLAEFANALFKKVRREEIAEEQARASVAILPDIVTFFPSIPLVEPALQLSFEIGHPVHDCIFLAAALQLGIPLVTADRKFHANCLKSGASYPLQLLGAPI
jgi:predicted nucleic acid-binding protein